MKPTAALLLLMVVMLALAGCARTPFASGVAAFKKGDYETAERAFRDAIAADENALDSHIYLGRIYGVQGDFGKGAKECRTAMGLDPDDGGAKLYYIILLQLDGRASQARGRVDRLPPGLMADLFIAPAQEDQPLIGEAKTKRINALKNGVEGY